MTKPTAWAALPAIETVEQLEGLGTPAPRVRDKVENHLHEVHREWIAATPLVFVATSSLAGRCDVSPKGDPAGFVRVLDDHTVALPERAGNKRMDGFHNILENPHVGLIFVIPGRPDTLRVNGSARLVTDGPFFDEMVVRSHRPALALVVTVDEVFFHCPKAFMRSRTWRPEQWKPELVRSYPAIAKALWRRDEPIDQIEARATPDAIDSQLYPDTTRGHAHQPN
jgi:uncharacterized protein